MAKVDERTHSLPCEHCGGDHKEWNCVWQKDEWLPYCPFCEELLWYGRDGIGWCSAHGSVTETWRSE